MSCIAWPSCRGELFFLLFSQWLGSCGNTLKSILLSEDCYDEVHMALVACVCARSQVLHSKVSYCHLKDKTLSTIFSTNTTRWAWMVSRCCSLRLSALISWWPYMISVCMPSFMHSCGSQIRGLTKSTGKAISEMREGKEGCIKCSSPVLLCCCGWWRREPRAESIWSDTRMDVYF